MPNELIGFYKYISGELIARSWALIANNVIKSLW